MTQDVSKESPKHYYLEVKTGIKRIPFYLMNLPYRGIFLNILAIPVFLYCLAVVVYATYFRNNDPSER